MHKVIKPFSHNGSTVTSAGEYEELSDDVLKAGIERGCIEREPQKKPQKKPQKTRQNKAVEPTNNK